MADNSHLSASGNGEEGDEVPKLPKRPVPAFLLYSQEKRKSLPSMTLQESTQKLSKMWKAASTEEKKKYITASLADKERYKSDMAVLAMKYPNAVQTLLSQKRRKKKSDGLEEATPLQKKRRKVINNSPILPETQGPSPPPLPPPLPPPPPPQVAKPRPNLQEVKVPGTNIPIFTAEFLDYNKKVNSQLMQLRRVNNELQLENGRLEESIDEQEKNLAIVQNKLEKLKQENEVLERNLSKLQDMIMKMFGHLCSDMTITSAEALLNHLLSSGIDRKTINSSVENITVD